MFHPAVHRRASGRGRAHSGAPRLAVIKGGGGEAERNPAKPVAVHLWRDGAGRSEAQLPALAGADGPDAPLRAVWEGEASRGAAVARATIALALLALGRASPDEADSAAEAVWAAR